MQYIEFEIAKQQIHNLKIKTVKEYYQKFKDKEIPAGIPRNPNRDYPEFINWPDFLGNGNIAAKDKKFYTYEECQELLLSLGIDSKEKFESWRKLKIDPLVPTRPDLTYKQTWVSWGVFFKTGRIADIEKHNQFLSYEEAKTYLTQFCFENEDQFYEWAKTDKRPYFIPASPRKTYGNDFISMGDFLGNGNFRTKDFQSYIDYKAYIQGFNFNSRQEFMNWAKINCKDMDFPSNPYNIYPEFEGWPEFLGYHRKVSLGEKAISSILASNNVEHIFQYTFKDCVDNRPLPFDAAIIKDNELQCLIEYHGIQHFIAVEFYGGHEALQQTQRRDRIKRKYCKEHNIPLLEITYKEDLETQLCNFLNNLGITIDLDLERKPALNRNYMPYEKAREIIQSMGLKTSLEFRKINKPMGIPYRPELQYKHNGWTSWGDFLGNGNISSKKAKFVSYEECRQWFLDNNVQSGEHWNKIRKHKPAHIPSHPDIIYKNNWPGWKEFLRAS